MKEFFHMEKGYSYKEKYPVKEIFDLLLNTTNEDAKSFILDDDPVQLSRENVLFFLKKGIVCVECGIKGEYFIKRIHKEIKHVYNLQLIGVRYSKKHNIHHIRMTKDHIRPKGLGGTNEWCNLQTMCYDCNNKKGSYYVATNETKLVGI